MARLGTAHTENSKEFLTQDFGYHEVYHFFPGCPYWVRIVEHGNLRRGDRLGSDPCSKCVELTGKYEDEFEQAKQKRFVRYAPQPSLPVRRKFTRWM